MQDVEVQTETSFISALKIKEIVLPSLDDHQIMRGFEHPFSKVLRFLDLETLDNPKKLTFEPQSMKRVFVTSEAILDRIGGDLLQFSQNYADELLLKEKKKKNSRGRPRSPRRRKKKGKVVEGLPLSFLRINPHYPNLETVYLHQF